MNGEQYCEILDGGVVESFEKLEMWEDISVGQWPQTYLQKGNQVV